MSIHKTDNGYLVRWREKDPVSGKTVQRAKRGFETKKAARAFEESLNRCRYSFGSLCSEYLDSLQGYANEETIQGKRKCYATHCGMFYDTDVREIDTKTMTSWKNYVYSLDLSTTTKNRIIENVRSVSKYGNLNYDLKDFARCVKLFPKTSDDVRQMSVLSPSDFAKAMSFCTNPIYRAFFVFLYHTGCRRGEAMALLKADIHGDRAELNKSIRRPTSLHNRLKNAQSKRSILLDSYVLAEIKPLMELEGEYVFGGLEPLRPTSIERHFKRACRDAGVKVVRIHDLRHSFISNAILNGANIVSVSKYVGHKNVTQTLNTYSHILENSEAALIDRMSGIY